MKGALIKELLTFKANRMISLLIVYAVAIILSSIFTIAWFTFMWFTLILFILAFVAPLNYALHDERHGWKSIEKALPVSTAKRVAARYIVCIAEMLLAVVVMSVFNILPGEKFLVNAANDAVLLFFIGMTGTAAILLISNIPKRGLRVPMGILAVIAFTDGILALLMGGFAGFKALMVFEKWMIPVVLIAGIAFIFISYLLTVHLSTQKLERRAKVRKSIVATAVLVAVMACLSTAVLGIKGRLIPEPMMDIDTFVEYKDEFGSILLHNVRKTSNQQSLSKTEMNEAIRKLAGKEVCGDDIEQRRAVLEQAGFKVWISDKLLDSYDDLEFSSKYGTLEGYSYSDSYSIYSDCPAKYVAVTDKKEMVFDDDDFASGISEAEFINLLEEKDMPVREFYEDAYYYGSVYRTYTVYIAYENVLTKEIFIDRIEFKVEEGKLSRYTVTALEDYDYDESETFPADVEYINESREYMLEYMRALSGKTVAGTDIQTCRDKLEEIGAQPFESSVFEKYKMGEGHVEISFNEASAYPGKVNFIKASGETGAKHYTSLTEGELAAIERKFSVGMSDEKLVELLEKEGFYPASINENIDYGYMPEKVYKCYTIVLEIDSYNGGFEECEIRIELYDGVVTNTIVYLDGYTELEYTEQYKELEELQEFLSSNTQSGEDMPLAELVDEFEKMSGKPMRSVEHDWDGVLFEAYEWEGEYYFSLVRQIPTGYNDEFYQLFMNVRYIYNESEYKGLDESEWGDSGDEKFFDGVRKSPAYNALKDAPIVAVDVYISET